MSDGGDLYDMLLDRLTDPYTRGRIRRALEMDLVLDTWLNGEREESFSTEAAEVISRATEDLTRQALDSGAVFPGDPMPIGYVRSVFQELLSSTALYQAQKYKGVREVDRAQAVSAEDIVRRFVATEREGLTGVAGIYFVISAHEDLGAMDYYRRMKREDFLLGTLHRPWSDMVLTNQLDVYLRMGLVKEIFTGEGEVLQLTVRGEETLALLRGLLEEAGELEWRSNAQRWVVFGELDYDSVIRKVLPDMASVDRDYVARLEIPAGANVLEIGAGTGRVTLDLGLARRVAEAGGTLVALEPSAALIHALRKKCLQQNATNVQIVQGVVEDLPFPDDTFDLVVSVAVLHFTDLERAAAEMARVTKPGGLVTAAVPTSLSFLDIPMVAMWFRPLQAIADAIGVPFGEKQGVPRGATETAFRRAGLVTGPTALVGVTIDASDPRSFLQFIVKGAAFYQNILSRLPFRERWQIIQVLDERGREIAASTTSEERKHRFYGEVVEGRKVPRTQ